MNEEILTNHSRELPIIEGMSPTPQKAAVEMDFPDALREVIAGKKITKLEWCNKEVVVVLEKLSDNKEYLLLYKDDGKPYKLILTDGDLKGEDWVVIG